MRTGREAYVGVSMTRATVRVLRQLATEPERAWRKKELRTNYRVLGPLALSCLIVMKPAGISLTEAGFEAASLLGEKR